MHKPTDEHIINDIREKLDNYRPAYNPESWQKMSNKLDQQKVIGNRTNFGTWMFGFFSGIILSIVIVSFYINQNNYKYQNSKPLIETNSTASYQIDSLKLLLHKKNNMYANNSSVYKFTQNHQKIDFNLRDNNNQLKLSPLPKSNIYINYIDPVSSDKNRSTRVNSSGIDIPKRLEPINMVQNDTIVRKNIVVPISDNNKEKNNNYNTPRKRNPFCWKKFMANFKLEDELLKNFTGPQLAKFYYSPELMIGNFQDKARMSHAIGLTTEGRITNRLSLGIGAEFRKFGWKKHLEYGSEIMKYETKIIIEATDTSAAITKTDSALVYRTDSTKINSGSWQYFEIPFNIRYKLTENAKSSLWINTGISAMIYNKEEYKSILTIDESTTETSETYKPYKNFHIPARFKLGLEYRYNITDRWSLSLESYYRWSWNSLGEHKLKPGAIGINAGVIYRFKEKRSQH